MINSVSNVSFKSNSGATDWKNLIESEGPYTQSPKTSTGTDTVDLSSQPQKKNKAGKVIGTTLAAVVVAGLALFGLSRGNILKIDKEATGLKMIGSKLAEVGEWIGTKMIDPLMNLFKGNKAKEVAETVAETVNDGAKVAENS